MISVIIPSTKNGVHYLAALLPDLSKEPDIEMIVIDNDSRDGTPHFLASYDCVLKINSPGRNFSQSNNQGAKLAQGDYFLFLNNDTRITPGFIQEMLNTFKLEPTIGIVGCLLFTMDNPKKVQHAGVMFNQDYVAYELGLPVEGCSPGITPGDARVKSIREVPAVTAACMMVSRKCFEDVGGFNEDFRNGWEDSDLCLRAREKGYKVYYNGQAVVYHHHFGSRGQGRFRFEKENRQLYDSIWVNTGRAKQVLEDFREA